MEIKHVINQIKISMQQDQDNNDVLHYFQTIVHDAALIRQLLYSSQKALFDNTEQQLGETPGDEDESFEDEDEE